MVSKGRSVTPAPSRLKTATHATSFFVEMAIFGVSSDIDVQPNQSPEQWIPPRWHPDFGDPAVELEQLRSLAICVPRALPNAQVSLEVPEPGLMALRLSLPDGHLAEVHSVPGLASGDGRRFAVFVFPGTADEVEACQTSVDEALTFILATCRREN
jgi:hypothetical protein